MKPDQVFDLALAFVLPTEGGVSNDPNDSGGLTNHGITQAEYDSWRKRTLVPLQSVTQITSDEVDAIYRSDYWNPIQGDNLSVDLPKLAIIVLDWSINHGPAGAIQTLQRCVYSVPDGIIGPHTLGAVRSYVLQNSEWALCQAFDAARKAWYIQDVAANSSQRRFLTGWENRIVDLEKYLTNINFSVPSTQADAIT